MTTFTELEDNDVTGDSHLPGHDTLMCLQTDPAACSGIAAGQAVRPSGPTGRRRRSPRRLMAHRARRTVVALVAGSWSGRAELVAEARSELAGL
jgi:hypothetical protein